MASVGKIARLKKGDKSRTLLHASVGNELIDAINAILNAKVSPQSAGAFYFSDGNVVLKLTPAASSDSALPSYPETDGTYVLGVVISGGSPTLQWLNTDTCS